MGQHEHIAMIDRVVAPPAFPGIINHGPRMGPNILRPIIQAPMFSKLCAAKSSSTSVAPPFWAKTRVRRIDQVAVVQTLERARREEPLHQPEAADAKRMLKALAGAGAVAIQRNAEAADPYFLHVSNPSFRMTALENYARTYELVRASNVLRQPTDIHEIFSRSKGTASIVDDIT